MLLEVSLLQVDHNMDVNSTNLMIRAISNTKQKSKLNVSQKRTLASTLQI